MHEGGVAVRNGDSKSRRGTGAHLLPECDLVVAARHRQNAAWHAYRTIERTIEVRGVGGQGRWGVGEGEGEWWGQGLGLHTMGVRRAGSQDVGACAGLRPASGGVCPRHECAPVADHDTDQTR